MPFDPGNIWFWCYCLVVIMYLLQVARLACSMTNDPEKAKMVRIAANRLEQLCPQVTSLSLTWTTGIALRLWKSKFQNRTSWRTGSIFYHKCFWFPSYCLLFLLFSMVEFSCSHRKDKKIFFKMFVAKHLFWHWVINMNISCAFPMPLFSFSLHLTTFLPYWSFKCTWPLTC